MRLVTLIAVGTAVFLAASLINLLFRYVELFIFAPISAVIFFLVYREIESYPKKADKFDKYLPVASVLSFVVFYLGIGIHAVSNYLSFIIYRTYGFYELIPAMRADMLIATPILNQIYFFDEILSHIFIYGGLFAILVCGAILQLNHPFNKKLTKWNKLDIIGSAITFAVFLFMCLVEAQTPIPAFLLVLPTGFLIFQHRKDN